MIRHRNSNVSKVMFKSVLDKKQSMSNRLNYLLWWFSIQQSSLDLLILGDCNAINDLQVRIAMYQHWTMQQSLCYLHNKLSLLSTVVTAGLKLAKRSFVAQRVSEWVSRVLRPTRHITGHFGDESPGNHLHWYWQLKTKKRKYAKNIKKT